MFIVGEKQHYGPDKSNDQNYYPNEKDARRYDGLLANREFPLVGKPDNDGRDAVSRLRRRVCNKRGGRSFRSEGTDRECIIWKRGQGDMCVIVGPGEALLNAFDFNPDETIENVFDGLQKT